VAIAEKSTDCASAMAAKMGHSGVTRPSSGQSLAVGAGEIGCAVDDCCAAAGGHQLKASATTFSWPGVCLMSDVNSAMKDSCRCWRADQGVVVQNRDVTSGLWSVTSTSSLAPGGQLGRPAACGRTGNLTQVWACRQQRASVTKNVRSPNVRRLRMHPSRKCPSRRRRRAVGRSALPLNGEVGRYR